MTRRQSERPRYSVEDLMREYLEREARRPRLLPPDQTAAILAHLRTPDTPPPEWHPIYSREIL